MIEKEVSLIGLMRERDRALASEKRAWAKVSLLERRLEGERKRTIRAVKVAKLARERARRDDMAAAICREEDRLAFERISKS